MYLTTDYFLPTNFTNLHESISKKINGDLYGRTNHTNAISEFSQPKIFGLVKIRATVQVAFKTIENASCKFVKFVGKIKSNAKLRITKIELAVNPPTHKTSTNKTHKTLHHYEKL